MLSIIKLASMSLTPSTMLAIGTPAPSFRLSDTVSGGLVALEDFASAPALVVMFLCNHCPYVIHVRAALAALVREYQGRGVAFVGINSNDVVKYPADSPERMREEARRAGYTFAYLFDETQQVAKAFRAACTPDFFVFSADRRLAYRGQMDGSRPGNSLPVTGQDLRAALDALLRGTAVPALQRPSMGCNIKWKPGNAPDYFG